MTFSGSFQAAPFLAQRAAVVSPTYQCLESGTLGNDLSAGSSPVDPVIAWSGSTLGSAPRPFGDSCDRAPRFFRTSSEPHLPLGIGLRPSPTAIVPSIAVPSWCAASRNSPRELPSTFRAFALRRVACTAIGNKGNRALEMARKISAAPAGAISFRTAEASWHLTPPELEKGVRAVWCRARARKP